MLASDIFAKSPQLMKNDSLELSAIMPISPLTLDDLTLSSFKLCFLITNFCLLETTVCQVELPQKVNWKINTIRKQPIL